MVVHRGSHRTIGGRSGDDKTRIDLYDSIQAARRERAAITEDIVAYKAQIAKVDKQTTRLRMLIKKVRETPPL